MRRRQTKAACDVLNDAAHSFGLPPAPHVCPVSASSGYVTQATVMGSRVVSAIPTSTRHREEDNAAAFVRHQPMRTPRRIER